MMGAKAAAEVLLQCRAAGDFSARSTVLYHHAWMRLFGHDFKLSQKGAELIWRFPILLDACANEVQRQGDAMMSKWAEVRGRRGGAGRGWAAQRSWPRTHTHTHTQALHGTPPTHTYAAPLWMSSRRS